MNSDLFYQKAKNTQKMFVDSTTLSTNNTTLFDKIYSTYLYVDTIINLTLLCSELMSSNGLTLMFVNSLSLKLVECSRYENQIFLKKV